MDDHLYILWTNADPITSEKMVFMYARNSLLRGWWKAVTLIIWGATARLAAESTIVQGQLEVLRLAGVELTACLACADQLGVTEALRSHGIEVKPWGEPLSDLLKEGVKILSI